MQNIITLPGAVLEGKYAELMLDALFIDHNYQRMLVEPKVKRLVKNWNPVGCGYLVVSRRSVDRYAILDGQHRYRAMNQLGIESCGCLVYEGLSRTDEAKAFQLLNVERALPTALDRFRAALQYEDYDCLQIKAVVEACGYHLDLTGGGKSGIRSIVAVSGLSKVYALGGADLLQDTLDTIAVCFEGEKRAVQAFCITGVGRFLKQYGDEPLFSRKKFINQMQKASFANLIRRKNFFIEAYGCGAESAMAISLLEQYNKQSSTRRLPNLFVIRAMEKETEEEEC